MASFEFLNITGLTELVGLIKGLLSDKVDKVTGKGLSTEDFTAAEKLKLASVEAGAEVNAVTSVNGQTGAVSVPVGATQTVTAKTMSASGWSSGVYSFETDFPNATYNIQVDLYEDCSSAQISAFQNATIVGSVTNNRVKATGTVPSIDIPVMVTATTK